MNTALRTLTMIRDEFLGWVQQRDGHYKFDGVQPVTMGGGSRHRATREFYRTITLPNA